MAAIAIASMNTVRKIGARHPDSFLSPQCGQLLALSLISFLHSLQVINAIFVSSNVGWITYSCSSVCFPFYRQCRRLLVILSLQLRSIC